MKECIGCHEPIDDGSRFCNRCGVKQPVTFIPSNEKSIDKVDTAWSPSVYYDPDNDPRNMLPIEAKWRPTFDRVGIVTIGIRDIPSSPTRIWMRETEWIVSNIKDGVPFEVPPETLARIEAVEVAGLEIDYWILMEEQPKPIPVPEPMLLDPVLIGVIGTDKNRGIWCVFGKWAHD